MKYLLDYDVKEKMPIVYQFNKSTGFYELAKKYHTSASRFYTVYDQIMSQIVGFKIFDMQLYVADLALCISIYLDENSAKISIEKKFLIEKCLLVFLIGNCYEIEKELLTLKLIYNKISGFFEIAVFTQPYFDEVLSLEPSFSSPIIRSSFTFKNGELLGYTQTDNPKYIVNNWGFDYLPSSFLPNNKKIKTMLIQPYERKGYVLSIYVVPFHNFAMNFQKQYVKK